MRSGNSTFFFFPIVFLAWVTLAEQEWDTSAKRRSTPYRPIYEAVGRDWETACFVFGLIVFRVMMDRPETWAFGRSPRKMDEVTGLTYFRITVN